MASTTQGRLPAVRQMMRATVLSGEAVLAVVGWEPDALAQDGSPPSVDVVVRGEKVRPPVPPKDRSVAGSVVSAERLRGAGTQVADVLRGEPGIGISETGGQGALSTASIRGATSAQTPVYLAGIRLNDDVAGTADLSLAPLWLLDRVEVYRGNAPIEADRLGIGGAIFLEPRRPRSSGIGSGIMAGSFGSRAGWADASVGQDRSGALLGVRVERSENDYLFADDRGTPLNRSDDVVRRRSNADVQTVDFWALGTSQLAGRARFDLVVNGLAREQGVPGLLLMPTQAARAAMRRSLIGAQATVPCSHDDRCVLTATSSALLAHMSLRDPQFEMGLGADRSDTSGQRSEESLSARVDLSDRVTVTPSVRSAVERLQIRSQSASVLHATRAFSRGAFSSEWRATRLATLRGLVAAECNGTSQGQAEFCDRLEPAGRIGVQLGQGEITFLANGGYYPRVPTLGELYGVSGTVRGNESLRSEHGTTVDAGVRWMGGAQV